ncbi:hypothetical protein [Thioclava sp. GXIMD4216]|uniref:hypothetical protein n=1 Tax=Thioclava sp. GXIMD4216 TaxID=3131929 RepID=UPI0030CC1257
MSERHIFPIDAVDVASLHCICGACGAVFVIEYDALTEDGVDVEHDFQDCPECGEIYDAQAVRFRAELIAKAHP